MSPGDFLIVTAELGFAPQETKAVTLTIMGRSNKEVAREMHISVAAVKLYLHNAYAKAGVANRMELTRRVFGILYQARENKLRPVKPKKKRIHH